MRLDDVLAWALPALLVAACVVIAALSIVWFVQLGRRSRRAAAAAELSRVDAGEQLLRLDDALAELDVELALSGALRDASAPPALRQARLSAQHARDDAFEAFAELTPTTHPAQVRRVARVVGRRAAAEREAVVDAQRAHAAWLRDHAAVRDQHDAARARFREVEGRIGDPQALLDDLASRFDADQWQDAARAAATLARALGEAEGLLDAAAANDGDAATALPLLADAERRIRSADAAAQALEGHHRALVDASHSVAGEIDAARTALAQVGADRTRPDDIASELHGMEGALTTWETDAARRPASVVDEVARLRERIDAIADSGRTAHDRLAGARSALPGALSAARAAIAHIAPDAVDAGIDARVRLAAAQRELAAAGDAHDPIVGVTAARRALRHAEDAASLSAQDRLTQNRRAEERAASDDDVDL